MAASTSLHFWMNHLLDLFIYKINGCHCKTPKLDSREYRLIGFTWISPSIQEVPRKNLIIGALLIVWSLTELEVCTEVTYFGLNDRV